MLSQQKATDLIYAFLRYHGLRLDSPLMHIWIARPGEVSRRSGFTVQVDIERPPAPQYPALMPPDQPLSDSVISNPVAGVTSSGGASSSSVSSLAQLDPDLIRLTAHALQWVLQQLIDQADILQIKPCDGHIGAKHSPAKS